jgi:hypothetical protein
MKRTMTDEQHTLFAQRLRKAEEQGQLGQAYGILRVCGLEDMKAVALKAGHSVLSGKDRALVTHIQQQVAAACRQLCDGFELRRRRELQH